MVKTIYTPEQGRAWLRTVKERGADGIKFFGAPPAIMEAALDECKQARPAHPAAITRRWR